MSSLPQGHPVVADMQAQREAPAMTIPDAIDKSEWLRRTPDGRLDPDKAREIIITLLSAIEASPSFLKASKLGLRTFTILPYDRAGHVALAGWITQAAAHGCRPEKVQDAEKILADWSQRTDLKWPD